MLAQVSSIQQERQGTEGLVAGLGKQSAALETWLASHEWKADAVAAALAKGSSEAGALDINKVIVPAGESEKLPGCVGGVECRCIFCTSHLTVRVTHRDSTGQGHRWRRG